MEKCSISLSMVRRRLKRSMKENNISVVHVIQEIPGTKEGKPKINIIGAGSCNIRLLSQEMYPLPC